MINEYAVDPDLLNNWERLRYYLSQFGFDQGRVIAQFPKQWISLVLKHFPKSNDDAASQRTWKKVTELIASVGTHFVSRNSSQWVATVPWLINVEREHALAPFHGILVSGERIGHDYQITDSETTHPNSHARWRTTRMCDIPRQARDMAAAIRPLLSFAKTLMFVDRYFDPREVRFRQPLFAFLAEVRRSNPNWSGLPITYQLGELHHHPSDFRDLCHGLGHNIPIGMRVRFKRWRFDELHPRDVVADRGGVNFEHGLDCSKEASSKERVRLTLHDRTYSEQLLKDFQGCPPRFTASPGGEVEVVGSFTG